MSASVIGWPHGLVGSSLHLAAKQARSGSVTAGVFVLGLRSSHRSALPWTHGGTLAVLTHTAPDPGGDRA